MSQKNEHWGIVGGGILGMTLALRLAQQGKQVTLIESSDRLGGLADAWQLGNIVWDRHYHVILLSDQHLRSLLKELGLEQDLQWVETKTGFYKDGRLYSISNAIEFLRFFPLNLIDKLRFAFTIIYGSKIKDWKKLEKISVTEWLTKWSGKYTFEKIWLPLLRSKLGENYRKASASFIWAIIARLYAARRTGLKKELFGYLSGGYGRILERFTEVLQESNVSIQLGSKVISVDSIEGNLVGIKLDNGEYIEFDKVILTTPAPVAAKVCPKLSEDEIRKLNNIEYQGIICASVLLKKPISKFYVTNITDTWVPFTGVIEMTALVDRSQFGGNSLVYLPKYVVPDDPAFELSDRELEEKFITALVHMYPRFERDDVICFQVSRVRHVLAIATLNYSKNLPPIKTSISGVYIINSAHILNGTLNVNETIQLAESALASID
ncbi:NAD(P)/FAD-dependent oxidoreductase [Pseudanabaena sp. FACHB-1998]|uniref:NAD(P)/FAD-dependent oxidoreductase n=1 Tax=Pseudanabaena sp. FACHB-1998 TaxID=2692858 RepID=UPI001681A421|nr:NAD(P)/FAD-dependent oxidoreductase [Pseudanabaena sp. FACHB-1998]MBD2179050.1 NAD(P)/FAD-dependent oxidoreductase [Pseudanabaena sp. FACHB-1998]